MELSKQPSSTRDAIVQEARRLTRTRSYLGWSFQDIADAVGMRKAGVHHHFPSKETLGIAVLDIAVQRFADWTRTAPQEPADKITASIAMYRDMLHAGHAMCSAGSFAPAWDCISDELRDGVREIRSAQIEWLTTTLCELRPDDAPETNRSHAGFVFAACQGALASSRMTGQVEDFDQAVTPVLAVIRHS